MGVSQQTLTVTLKTIELTSRSQTINILSVSTEYSDQPKSDILSGDRFILLASIQ